ncbi:hypothetical protein G6F40_014513 [Rhizopus arrhizus]|nr:hypothetical protein G6F40_014513 [Rhizopus arrhizus]
MQSGLARIRNLLACGQQILVERGVGMQARHGGGAHETPFEDVALPVHIAHQAALTVVAASRLDGVGAVRRDLRQDQRPGPADGGMAGRIGAVLAQPGFVGGRAGRLAVDHERARTLVLVLGCLGGRAGIDAAAFQQTENWLAPAGKPSSASLVAWAKRGVPRRARASRLTCSSSAPPAAPAGRGGGARAGQAGPGAGGRRGPRHEGRAAPP